MGNISNDSYLLKNKDSAEQVSEYRELKHV